VKEKILMKFDVNALASTSGSMGVFLVEYGIFLNNKRTLKSYDLKDEVITDNIIKLINLIFLKQICRSDPILFFLGQVNS